MGTSSLQLRLRGMVGTVPTAHHTLHASRIPCPGDRATLPSAPLVRALQPRPALWGRAGQGESPRDRAKSPCKPLYLASV